MIKGRLARATWLRSAAKEYFRHVMTNFWEQWPNSLSRVFDVFLRLSDLLVHMVIDEGKVSSVYTCVSYVLYYRFIFCTSKVPLK